MGLCLKDDITAIEISETEDSAVTKTKTMPFLQKLTDLFHGKNQRINSS